MEPGLDAERLALGTLCAELPALREECLALGAKEQHLLTRIEAEARARRPVTDLLRELVGPDVVRGLSTGLPGAGPGRADDERFGCPDGACDRLAHTVPAGPVPRCAVTGRSMTRR
ncbi:hypothetical protein [Amycolatopsis vancoresmycina]|uniref:Uncharacterized protein n=1 Tax=Amycolatopsis vancoresmycina DSM 44592 TaxID=1292037 RepID=R1I372_9PSEU|nr:hypothetical protein [Amycolatopsis vancoresmycina]EOD64919.1 hypothetical protein H480_29321 [Amycolatopsis vancoresmycina DSM 44592]